MAAATPVKKRLIFQEVNDTEPKTKTNDNPNNFTESVSINLYKWGF